MLTDTGVVSIFSTKSTFPLKCRSFLRINPKLPKAQWDYSLNSVSVFTYIRIYDCRNRRKSATDVVACAHCLPFMYKKYLEQFLECMQMQDPIALDFTNKNTVFRSNCNADYQSPRGDNTPGQDVKLNPGTQEAGNYKIKEDEPTTGSYLFTKSSAMAVISNAKWETRKLLCRVLNVDQTRRTWRTPQLPLYLLLWLFPQLFLHLLPHFPHRCSSATLTACPLSLLFFIFFGWGIIIITLTFCLPLLSSLRLSLLSV